MTRLAVLSDIHASDLGYRVNPATGLNGRFEDALEITRWVARDAAARDAAALIVAGDFTEARSPAPWRVKMIAEALGEFGRPYVLVCGNHDQLHAGRSIADVLGQMLPDARGFSRPGIAWIGRTAVCVIPYLDRHWLRAQPGFETVPDAELFKVLAEQYLVIARGLWSEARDADAEQIVMTGHQTLSGGRMTEAQQAFLGDLSLVVDSRALAAVGFDAVLMGHLHWHQALSTDPLVAYAGSPVRTDFGEAQQTKGYLVVDVEAGEAAMDFVETPARRFVTLQGAPTIENSDLGLTNIDGFVQDVRDAIVRCLDVPPEVDVAEVRRMLEAAGAFEITEIRRRPVEAPESNGGLSESLSGEQALSAYFEGDPDRDALVDRGRGILEVVR